MCQAWKSPGNSVVLHQFALAGKPTMIDGVLSYIPLLIWGRTPFPNAVRSLGLPASSERGSYGPAYFLHRSLAAEVLPI